jgi:RNA-splicing ligase RtcB
MAFSCDNINEPEIKGKLDKIRQVKSIQEPMVCLPNIHPKKGLESPPQFVAATDGMIVPQLTAPAMNCGMSVFKTDLTKDEFSPEMLQNFATNLRKEIARRLSRFQTLLQWVGLYTRSETKYDISKTELEEFFLHGSYAAIQKYGLDSNNLDWIEYRGCVLADGEKTHINFHGLVPRSSYTNGRHELGYNFGGNHFLEIHYVEKILDAQAAEKFGIWENQLLLFYHGGGGHATYHLGRYFARREKNAPSEKFALFWLKLLFHFGSLEGIKNFRIRWYAYFSRKPFPEIPVNSPEGQRLLQSIKIGLNYGYAFRTALLKRIHDALPKHARVSFLWDGAHNSIMEEVWNDKSVLVHRQDAMRVFDGKPAMIAGWNTLAYIGIGQEPKDLSTSSITPSAGKTIGKYRKEELSKEDPNYVSYLSKRKEPMLTKEQLWTSEGLFAITKELEQAGIVKPVAHIRPLGGIKGH